MRSHRNRLLRGATCAAALALSAMPLRAAVTINWATIGNPGNTADTQVMSDSTTGYGSVADIYRISKTEVTNSQYVEFLNATAQLRDPSSPSNDLYYLYNSGMTSSDNSGGINRSGTGTGGDPFVYSVQSGEGNFPVTHISWYDSIRFANWLHNGQGSGSTETGAYTLGTLGGGGVPTSGLSITRNSGAKVFLPSENEWYKSAYYNGSTNTYFDYATGTDTTPNSDHPTGAVANAANFIRDDSLANGFNDGYAVTGSPTYNSSTHYLTEVGAYTGSPSYYGTFDQGGSVWEWNEALIDTFERGLRSGSWNNDSAAMLASNRFNSSVPDYEPNHIGFRVASIPEPSSCLTALSAAIGFWWLRRRRG